MFSNLPGWQRRPWQPDPHSTLINIPSKPLSWPSAPLLLFLLAVWATDAQVPTQSERSNDPSPAPTPLPLLKLGTKLSPRTTFSPLPPAAYQRAASRPPPPVCPCRPGWTRAGRSSAGPGGLSGTRRCRRECPGRRDGGGGVSVSFVYGHAGCSGWGFQRTALTVATVQKRQGEKQASSPGGFSAGNWLCMLPCSSTLLGKYWYVLA